MRRLFGARIAYALWALPLLAAAAPFLPARIVLVQAAPAGATPIPAVTEAGPPVFTGDLAPVAASLQMSLVQWAFLLWAAGVIVGLGVLVWSQRRFLQEADEEGIGPAVVGVLSPRIVKPRDFAQRFTPDEQRLVLAHEHAHIARQDCRVNGAVVLAQCLCWFNPLIHLAARFLRIDQELACDEAVLSKFPSARTLYARALLKTQLANRPLPLGCYWPAGTRHPLLERIAMIKSDEFSRARRLAGVAAIAALCAGAAATAWAARPEERVMEPAPKAVAQRAVPPATSSAHPAPPQTEPAATGEAQLPSQISLTNAGGELARFPVRDPAAVAEAIREGDVAKAMAAGANARDLGDVLRTSCRGSEDYAACRMVVGVVPGTERYLREGIDDEGHGQRLILSGRNASGQEYWVNVLEMSDLPNPPGTIQMPSLDELGRTTDRSTWPLVALGFPSPLACTQGSRDVRCNNRRP